MSKYLKAMLAQKREFMPPKGFNLVGLDDFELPGDQLFLIGHYTTRAEAVTAEKLHNTRNKDVRTFIYGEDEAKESLAVEMTRLITTPTKGIDDWD